MSSSKSGKTHDALDARAKKNCRQARYPRSQIRLFVQILQVRVAALLWVKYGMCMYVCVYIYIYTYVYVYVYICSISPIFWMVPGRGQPSGSGHQRGQGATVVAMSFMHEHVRKCQGSSHVCADNHA